MSAAEAIGDDVAWLDGASLPRSRLCVPVGDAGFVLGATVTEQLRTFRGELFLPADHGRRLAASLAVVGIESPWSIAAMLDAAAEIAAHNHRRVEPANDLGLVIFATPGDLAAQHCGRAGRPRVAIHTFPLAFALWSSGYDDGMALRTVATSQVPNSCWPLAAKVRSRLHYHLADREAAAMEPGSRAVLAHGDGRISETSTANIAIVKDGTVKTPPPSDALEGVSLACARRLAHGLGITWDETSLTVRDLATADEILLTSTPSCILPATRLDGRPIGTGRPGPVFHGLLESWSRLVGLDIADQARRHRRTT